jgi:hypothetical protein
MSYTSEQIARVCHESTRALRVASANVPAPPWPLLNVGDVNLCIANVESLRAGRSPLYPDELSAAIVGALTTPAEPEAAPAPDVANLAVDSVQSHVDQLRMQAATTPGIVALGRDWLAGRLPWILDAAESDRWRFEQLAVALGMFLAEHGEHADPPAHLRTRLQEPPSRAPRVCDPVHYVSYGTPGGEYSRECRAAIITEVHGDDPVPEHGVPYVGLCVLNPTGQFFNRTNKYDGGQPDNAGGTNLCGGLDFAGGTWHWPAGS